MMIMLLGDDDDEEGRRRPTIGKQREYVWLSQLVAQE
jgi:hypothetical protein